MSPRQAKGKTKGRVGRALALAAQAPGAQQAPITGDFFEPELAKLHPDPPKGEDWLHEVKWDGYPILATVAGGQVQLWSRNALPWAAKIPATRKAVQALGLDSARLDGELIALDAKGSLTSMACSARCPGKPRRPWSTCSSTWFTWKTGTSPARR